VNGKELLISVINVFNCAVASMISHFLIACSLVLGLKVWKLWDGIGSRVANVKVCTLVAVRPMSFFPFSLSLASI
jgi:hypothetical protein